MCKSLYPRAHFVVVAKVAVALVVVVVVDPLVLVILVFDLVVDLVVDLETDVVLLLVVLVLVVFLQRNLHWIIFSLRYAIYLYNVVALKIYDTLNNMFVKNDNNTV
jgi:hypothetical protein